MTKKKIKAVKKAIKKRIKKTVDLPEKVEPKSIDTAQLYEISPRPPHHKADDGGFISSAIFVGVITLGIFIYYWWKIHHAVVVTYGGIPK